jgi:hypothetical protein
MTELATVETNKLATIPEHLRGDVGNRDGKDNVGQGDLLIPRLSLAQSMTPQLKRTNENYNPDLEEGQFFNSVTGEIYGDSVTVIPLHFFKQYIQFGEDRRIVKIYDNEEVPSAASLAFVDGQKPLVTEFKNRMSLLLKEDGSIQPVVVSFKSSGLKVAKKWNYLISEKNLPGYAYTYNLQSVAVPGDKGEYFSVKVTRGDFTPAALYENSKQYFAALQDAGVKIDTSGVEPESDEDTSFDQ